MTGDSAVRRERAVVVVVVFHTSRRLVGLSMTLTAEERCSSENCLCLRRRRALEGFVVDGDDEVAFFHSFILFGCRAGYDVLDGASVVASILGRFQVQTQVVRLGRRENIVAVRMGAPFYGRDSKKKQALLMPPFLILLICL